jgi:hypothetical protein
MSVLRRCPRVLRSACAVTLLLQLQHANGQEGLPPSPNLPKTEDNKGSAEKAEAPKEGQKKVVPKPAGKNQKPEKGDPDGPPVAQEDPAQVAPLPPPDMIEPPGSSVRRNALEAARNGSELEHADAGDVQSSTSEAPGAAKGFTLPGFYGSAPQEFTPGKGRLLGPRFRASANIGFGYDDNVDQGTTGAGGEKSASAFTSVGLNAGYQTANPMQLFVWDGSAGADLYWNQQDPDYNVSLGLAFQRRFVSPAKLTANVGLSYRTQPDYGQVNLVLPQEERGGEGDRNFAALSASAKIDLSYAWTAQFSTVTSLSADTILYGGSQTDANSIDVTFGNELRYRVDRFAWVGEARYQFNARPNDQEEESNTLFLLGGVDWHLGPWVQVTSRLGGTVRNYTAGGSTTSPHAEFAVTFQPNIQNAFSMNLRYGLERTAVGAGDSKTFRVGVSYTRVFSSRMSGTIAADYSNRGEAIVRDGNGEPDGGSSSGNEQIFDATASLNYRLTSKLSLSASLTCTRGTAAPGVADPDRNRISLNASYEF